MGRTIIILKPDALALGVQGELRAMLAQAGLCCVERKPMQLTNEVILKWRNWGNYDDWFWEHVDFMISAPVEIWLVSGPGAVTQVLDIRKILRNKYAASEIQNVLHCPDNAEEAEHEIGVFLNGRS